MELIDAIRESSRLALTKPVADHLVVVAIYVGLVSLGQSVILGILFSLPLATLFVLSVYEVRVKSRCRHHPGPERPLPSTLAGLSRVLRDQLKTNEP